MQPLSCSPMADGLSCACQAALPHGWSIYLPWRLRRCLQRAELLCSLQYLLRQCKPPAPVNTPKPLPLDVTV